MNREPLPRLDTSPEVHDALLPLCRLKPGEIWEDARSGHRVGVLDAADASDISRLMASGATAGIPRSSDTLSARASVIGAGSPGREISSLGIHDPPYNIPAGRKASGNLFSIDIDSYLGFSRGWIVNAVEALAPDSSLYIWTGADQERGFQPLPELILLLREFPCLESRSLITLRNQRGYGTGKNWMCVRQELLYYVKGKPAFTVQYTDIPKILHGYYKEVGGVRTENTERCKSPTIRPGNVWVDIQQVFYRLPENVPGAYAQKPLKAVTRIIEASSGPGDIVTDFFSHSGTALLASEITGRRCYAAELDPVFAELSIRRLEHYRETGKPGFQCDNPFPEWGPAGTE